MRKAATAVLTLVLTLLVLLPACTTNRAALQASKRNVVHIDNVKIGQTAEQVVATMGKPPESRSEAVLADGTREERWNYLTDYDNHVNTTFVLRNGVVAEITQTEWLGNGYFGSPGAATAT